MNLTMTLPDKLPEIQILACEDGTRFAVLRFSDGSSIIAPGRDGVASGYLFALARHLHAVAGELAAQPLSSEVGA